MELIDSGAGMSNILVAEDESHIMILIQRKLETAGHLIEGFGGRARPWVESGALHRTRQTTFAGALDGMCYQLAPRILLVGR